MITFKFTADASGSPDPCTLPSNATGTRQLRIRPPVGHAWRLYDKAALEYDDLAMDEPAVLIRLPGQPPFSSNEIIGYVVLDTGSGTFRARLD